jgi:hypothetical protein
MIVTILTAFGPVKAHPHIDREIVEEWARTIWRVGATPIRYPDVAYFPKETGMNDQTKDSPEVAAAREAYRDACVALVSSIDLFHAPIGPPYEGRFTFQVTAELAFAACKAKHALDAAIARHQQRDSDEAIKAILAQEARAICESRYGEGQSFTVLARVLLEKIRAAGFDVTRRQA